MSTVERPARDPLVVLGEVFDLAKDALDAMQQGRAKNGNYALTKIKATAQDAIRHALEDRELAAAAARIDDPEPPTLTGLSPRQELVANALARKWGQSAVSLAHEGRAVITGLAGGDIPMEEVTVDRLGIDDAGADVLLLLEMQRERRLRERLRRPAETSCVFHPEVAAEPGGSLCQTCAEAALNAAAR